MSNFVNSNSSTRSIVAAVAASFAAMIVTSVHAAPVEFVKVCSL